MNEGTRTGIKGQPKTTTNTAGNVASTTRTNEAAKTRVMKIANHIKIAKHLQTKCNETTNILQKENLPRNLNRGSGKAPKNNLSELDERELRGQSKTASSRTAKVGSVMLRSWNQKRMNRFRYSVA